MQGLQEERRLREMIELTTVWNTGEWKYCTGLSQQNILYEIEGSTNNSFCI